MTNYWLLVNRGDAPGMVGKFLRDVWRNGGLKGMVVPRRLPGTFSLAPCLIEDWLLLDGVDPFAPVMTRSAAPLVIEQLRHRPGVRLAALLRPCELRAVDALAAAAGLPRENLLSIGVDCLGVLPAEAYAAQAEREGLSEVTRLAVESAQHAEKLAFRLQPACQTCLEPEPTSAEISLSVLGPAGKEVLLVGASDGDFVRRLRLPEITEGEAPARLVAQLTEARRTTADSHRRARANSLSALASMAPAQISSLQTLLQRCAPCRACLEACPLYTGQFSPGSDGAAEAAIRAWLADCVQCGLCEAACPQHLSLTILFSQWRQTAGELAPTA